MRLAWRQVQGTHRAHQDPIHLLKHSRPSAALSVYEETKKINLLASC